MKIEIVCCYYSSLTPQSSPPIFPDYSIITWLASSLLSLNVDCLEINCGSPGVLPNGWLEGSRTTLHAVVTFRSNIFKSSETEDIMFFKANHFFPRFPWKFSHDWWWRPQISPSYFAVEENIGNNAESIRQFLIDICYVNISLLLCSLIIRN